MRTAGSSASALPAALRCSSRWRRTIHEIRHHAVHDSASAQPRVRRSRRSRRRHRRDQDPGSPWSSSRVTCIPPAWRRLAERTPHTVDGVAGRTRSVTRWPGTEQRRADPDFGRALLHSDLEIATHSHRADVEAEIVDETPSPDESPPVRILPAPRWVRPSSARPRRGRHLAPARPAPPRRQPHNRPWPGRRWCRPGSAPGQQAPAWRLRRPAALGRGSPTRRRDRRRV